MHANTPHPSAPLALGLDAGGTATRWALARGAGEIVAEGEVAGFSAVELRGSGRARVMALLGEVAAAARAVGTPTGAHAGLTGLDGEGRDLAPLLAEGLGLPGARLSLGSDVETAYLNLLQPGAGYLVYAGTGSFAAFLDAEGTLHRAGGRGVILDDGGGGFWIAREALRRIWRAEDERPGGWQESVLAQEVFVALGGSDWGLTRQLVYGGGRGEVGRLALAVARAADRDPAAGEILREAGAELARLGRALIARFGPRPIVLSGRAATLHPILPEAMQAALPPDTPFDLRPCRSHHAAARLALTRLKAP